MLVLKDPTVIFDMTTELSVFESEIEARLFPQVLSELHPSLKFTCEIQNNGALSFLDVIVHKSDLLFLTSVYRKNVHLSVYPLGLFLSKTAKDKRY